MENKVKLQAKYEPKYESVEIAGQEIKVMKRIPYEEKLNYAQEFASMVCVIDEKQGLAYEAYDTEALSLYMACKYYTNIDVEEYEFDMGALHDNLIPYFETIKQVCLHDLIIADAMASTYIYRTIEIYNMQNSLSQKAKMSFAGLLSGEDLLKTIAESRVVNEEMIDLLTKAKKQDAQDQSVVVFPWAAKKGE